MVHLHIMGYRACTFEQSYTLVSKCFSVKHRVKSRVKFDCKLIAKF